MGGVPSQRSERACVDRGATLSGLWWRGTVQRGASGRWLELFATVNSEAVKPLRGYFYIPVIVFIRHKFPGMGCWVNGIYKFTLKILFII